MAGTDKSLLSAIRFLSNDDHLRFGSCIKRAIDLVGRRVALVASGDLESSA